MDWTRSNAPRWQNLFGSGQNRWLHCVSSAKCVPGKLPASKTRHPFFGGEVWVPKSYQNRSVFPFEGSTGAAEKLGESKRKDLGNLFGMTFPNRGYIGEKQKAWLRHDFHPYLYHTPNIPKQLVSAGIFLYFLSSWCLAVWWNHLTKSKETKNYCRWLAKDVCYVSLKPYTLNPKP